MTKRSARRCALSCVTAIALAPVAARAQAEISQDQQPPLSNKQIQEIIVTDALLHGVAPAGPITATATATITNPFHVDNLFDKAPPPATAHSTRRMVMPSPASGA